MRRRSCTVAAFATATAVLLLAVTPAGVAGLTQQSTACAVGNVVAVKSSGGSYLGAPSKQLYDQVRKAAATHDLRRANELVLSGRFTVLNPGALLLVLRKDGAHAKARVKKDPAVPAAVDKVVWIACAWVR